jgi:hypothetical protein
MLKEKEVTWVAVRNRKYYRGMCDGRVFMGSRVSQRVEEAKRSLLQTPTKVCLTRLASNHFLGLRI